MFVVFRGGGGVLAFFFFFIFFLYLFGEQVGGGGGAGNQSRRWNDNINTNTESSASYECLLKHGIHFDRRFRSA